MDITFTIGAKLEAGLIHATNLSNAERKAANPEAVDETPQQYAKRIIGGVFQSYARQALREGALLSAQTKLTEEEREVLGITS